MVQIKILSGVFGWNHDGKYDLVHPGTCIEVDEALARRLVEQKGVAEYAAPAVPDAPELPDGVTGVPEYRVDMTAKELRAIGETCGLTFPERMTKAEMVAALDAHIEANTVDGADLDDGQPDAEDAPTFDAAEAVQ